MGPGRCDTEPAVSRVKPKHEGRAWEHSAQGSGGWGAQRLCSRPGWGGQGLGSSPALREECFWLVPRPPTHSLAASEPSTAQGTGSRTLGFSSLLWDPGRMGLLLGQSKSLSHCLSCSAAPCLSFPTDKGKKMLSSHIVLDKDFRQQDDSCRPLMEAELCLKWSHAFGTPHLPTHPSFTLCNKSH